EIGDAERPGMGLAVLSDKAGPVNREANGQLLDRDVMYDLVVAALQESRVDRGERLHAFGGEARGKGHRMLLGDADIEGALREFVAKQIKARARWHRRGDRDDALILLGFLDQRLGKDGR